jgi:hypothetical protein
MSFSAYASTLDPARTGSRCAPGIRERGGGLGAIFPLRLEPSTTPRTGSRCGWERGREAGAGSPSGVPLQPRPEGEDQRHLNEPGEGQAGVGITGVRFRARAGVSCEDA